MNLLNLHKVQLVRCLKFYLYGNGKKIFTFTQPFDAVKHLLYYCVANHCTYPGMLMIPVMKATFLPCWKAAGGMTVPARKSCTGVIQAP